MKKAKFKGGDSVSFSMDYTYYGILELIETSEQIAVYKFREELKEKINNLKEFNLVESSYIDLEKGVEKLNWVKVIKKEEILKLLEE